MARHHITLLYQSRCLNNQKFIKKKRLLQKYLTKQYSNTKEIEVRWHCQYDGKVHAPFSDTMTPWEFHGSWWVPLCTQKHRSHLMSSSPDPSCYDSRGHCNSLICGILLLYSTGTREFYSAPLEGMGVLKSSVGMEGIPLDMMTFAWPSAWLWFISWFLLDHSRTIWGWTLREPYIWRA